MRITGTCLLLLTVGCASSRAPAPGPAPSGDPILAAIGLDGFEHHLEQHPDVDCRSTWRPEDLSIRYRTAAPPAASIVKTASSFEGVRYVYGGVGPKGLDCSAFVNKVFATFGYDLPRTAREQHQVGLRLARRDLRPGDLLFFHERPGGGRVGHVALFVGGDRFIHAVRGKGRVTYDRLSSRYYSERFAGGRRILAMPPGRYSDRVGEAKAGFDFASPAALAAHFGAGPGPCREQSFGRVASGP